MLGQLIGDRVDRVDHPLVVRRQEADERDEQCGCVERVGLVVLAEDASVGDAPLEDVLADLVGDLGPALEVVLVAGPVGEPAAAVQRDPAHQLGGDVVLGLSAGLPDSLVGLLPDVDRCFDLVAEGLPELMRQVVLDLGVDVDRVEQGAVDVVLALVVRTVPDPNRLGSFVAAQSVEGRLGQVPLAVDPVHDLQPGMVVLEALLVDVREPAHEVSRLVIERERVEGPEREGRVADPGVAVVPVALAARRLG